MDSASSGSTALTITSTSETVAAGSTASYPVTMPTSVTSVSVTCLNLPTGATCSYSSTINAVTITTSSTTPKGTYQIIVVFTETVSGAASGFILLPILLLPLGFMRKKLAAQEHLAYGLSGAGSDGYGGPQYRLRRGRSGSHTPFDASSDQFGLGEPHNPVGNTSTERNGVRKTGMRRCRDNLIRSSHQGAISPM